MLPAILPNPCGLQHPTRHYALLVAHLAQELTDPALDMLDTWYIRKETLTAAPGILDNSIWPRPVAQAWGAGTCSSSDGMRVTVGGRTGHRAANPKYFGPERGITFYGHLYGLDTLCLYDPDFATGEYFTDTMGSTAPVFGLDLLLGCPFSPPIRDVLDQHLYTLSGIGVPEVLQSLVTACIRPRLIVEHWTDLRRMAAAIQ